MDGSLFVISAPSGTGKTTLCREMVKGLPSLVYSVSATTREPRKGEKEGVDYFFVSRERFQAMIKEDGFIEHAQVFGHWYGTPKAPVEEALKNGRDVLMDVDVQGAMHYVKNPNAVLIFLLPPSMAVLEQRLMNRKTDDAAQIKKRIATARQEIGSVHHYHYAICNDDLAEAIRMLKSIVRAERCRTQRNHSRLVELGFTI